MIRSGDLRAYRLTAPQRMASLLDVPTATEHGVPSLSIGMWFDVYAPVGTPKPVIATLNKAFREIVQDKTVAEKLAGIETYLLPIDPGDARGRPRQARLADRPVAADHREGRRPGGVVFVFRTATLRLAHDCEYERARRSRSGRVRAQPLMQSTWRSSATTSTRSVCAAITASIGL
jgi:hypothetical protein